jgi:hypothetical protein
MELLLKIVAVALLGAAAYFYSTGDPDWTFAGVVLAACSFFLSMRFRLKKQMVPAESEDDENDTTTPAD